MWHAAAPLVALIVASAPATDRVLVCRARVVGDPALARADALAEATRELDDQTLDYGVPCESNAEAARAARRAGLGHAVATVADGRTEGSLFELTVVDADERVVSVRRLALPPGEGGGRPVAASLAALVAELPHPARLQRDRHAALGIAGGGAALLAAGVALALVARGDADRANAAGAPEAYLRARSGWQRSRGLSGLALGLGGAAVGFGLVWRFELMGER
jgi:hypothetical protein